MLDSKSSNPNKRKRYWLLLSVLFVALSCFGIRELSQRFGDPEAHEMTKRVTGCLKLSTEENKKVSELVKQILNLKNKPSTSKDESKKLDTLNIELSKLLNQYTFEKLKGVTSDFSDVKATMKKYKGIQSSDTENYIAAYEITDGGEIEKVKNLRENVTIEL